MSGTEISFMVTVAEAKLPLGVMDTLDMFDIMLVIAKMAGAPSVIFASMTDWLGFSAADEETEVPPPPPPPEGAGVDVDVMHAPPEQPFEQEVDDHEPDEHVWSVELSHSEPVYATA